MNIKIEKVCLSDTEKIEKLTQTIWYNNFPAFLSYSQIKYMLRTMKSTEIISSKLDRNDYNCFFIILNNIIVGYLSYGIDKTFNEMRFNEMYILPEFQKQGIGSYVFSWTTKKLQAKGYKKILVYFNKNNQASKKICEKMDFKLYDTVKVSIGNGYYLDDIIMSKDI